MLTYGNWCYPDEDPLAKRRKTNKTDSNKAKEQTSTNTGSNNITYPNKPLLTVRRLVGDRLSMPKSSRKNSPQREDFSKNAGREANNPYCVQGYSVVDPAWMFGVRNVRNAWPGRVRIPNEPSRYEYRPSAIARPHPLRFRPVFNPFPMQSAYPGWVRASVSSAFHPVRHICTEFQTPRVTTQPIMTEHSSSTQSLGQMASAVRSSRTRVFKPAAQSITTAKPSSRQFHESSRFKPSRIPVHLPPPPSRRTAIQTTCSVTASVRTSLPEDLSVNKALSTARSISAGSSTSQTSPVTTKTVMVAHSSSVPSPRSMVASVTDFTTTSLPVDLSAKNDFSTARMKLFESPQSEDSKSVVQLITTTPPSSIQPQESPKFQPSLVPVQTVKFSPSSSLQTANQTSCSATAKTSLAEEFSADSAFSTARIIRSGSQESPKFQPSHIPVQTVMFSPSSSAANQSLCSVTTATTPAKTSWSEEHSANSTFINVRIKSSGSPTSQISVVTTQSFMTASSSSSSFQAQESPKFQPSHISVPTIMYSPPSSLRAAIQSFCSATTNTTTTVTTPLAEDLSTNKAFSTAWRMSTGSSTSQTSLVTTQSVLTARPISIESPSSMVGSVLDSTTTSSPIDLSTNRARIAPAESSQSEDSKLIAQPIATAFPPSLQPQSKPQFCQLPPEISPPPSPQPEESSKSQTPMPTNCTSSSVQPPVSSNSQTSKLTTHQLLLPKPQPLQSSKPSISQASKPTTQSNTIAPLSSLQSSELMKTQTSKLTSHLLLLSPPCSIQSSEPSTSQTSKSTSQPVTAAPSSSTDSTTTQTLKHTTHLLLLSKPQPLQLSESSKSQSASLTKLLFISPPVSQSITATTTSTAVVSSSIGGESLSEVALDLDEAVVQSVVGAIKVDIPDTSKTTTRRKEDEIEEKDALLQRIYSVPAFGGKRDKRPKFYQEMLTKPKLCHLFKCMASDCSFTCNQKTEFDEHIELHGSKRGTQKEPSKNPSEENDEPYDWQQCAYCCESPVYPTTSLTEHVITEHGYCEYQCAYCFYRALFQNYVDIHQSLAHRKILKNKPRLIFKCKTFLEGPTVEVALKKIGRRRCVRPYHCDQCGSEFLITEEFMNHLLKEHQSVTSYTCHICKNVCLKPDRLVVHYKLHSYSTYQCAYCLHGTETERKMIFHLCTFHFAQPACLYVRAWNDGKQVQSEDKSKKPKNKTKFTSQLDCLQMISYDIEATRGDCTLEEASDEDSVDDDDDRLVIDESQDLNDIIAELGITTETELSEETIPLLNDLASVGNSTTEKVSMSTLLPNARFSLEAETESESVLISSGSSSNSSSN